MAACGGGGSDDVGATAPAPQTVGGSLTSLASGTSVMLLDNSGDALTVSSSGPFTFATRVAVGSPYAVTIGTQPVGQTCTVANGTGTVGTNAVTSVAVTCVAQTFSIAVTVSGLATGQNVVLADNGTDLLTAGTSGVVAFATRIAYGGAYAVTVSTPPTGQACTVANGAGTNVMANVTNVTVTCSTLTFPISGTLTGLDDGVQLAIQNNGADTQTLTSNGALHFTIPVAFNSAFAVTVSSQPFAQRCTVTNGAAASVTAAVGNVVVNCVARTAYAYGANHDSGTVSQFVINPDGRLTPMSAPTVAVSFPFSVVGEPSGRYVYVGGSNQISQFIVGADGSLTTMSPATIATSGNNASLVVDPAGKFVYATNSSGGIERFSIGTAGALAHVDTVTSDPSTYVSALGLSPGGKALYATNFGTQSISEFTIAADGSLSLMTPPSVATDHASPWRLAVDPVRGGVYVSHQFDTTISQFSASQAGALTTLGPFTNPDIGGALIVDHQGRFLYTFKTSLVARYPLASDGHVSGPSVDVMGAGYAHAFAFHPSHKFLYETDQSSQLYWAFSVAADGSLTTLGSVPAGSVPYDLTVIFAN